MGTGLRVDVGSFPPLQKWHWDSCWFDFYTQFLINPWHSQEASVT